MNNYLHYLITWLKFFATELNICITKRCLDVFLKVIHRQCQVKWLQHIDCCNGCYWQSKAVRGVILNGSIASWQLFDSIPTTCGFLSTMNLETVHIGALEASVISMLPYLVFVIDFKWHIGLLIGAYELALVSLPEGYFYICMKCCFISQPLLFILK